MKEINELMQMRIFDLLEGNLNAKEAEALHKEIENDSSLKREFELMSKTYLPVEEIAFANKKSLYKKPGLFIWFNSTLKYAAAACFVLLLGGIAVFWYGKKDTENGTASKTNSGLNKQFPQTKNDDLIHFDSVQNKLPNTSYIFNPVHSKSKNIFIAPVIPDKDSFNNSDFEEKDENIRVAKGIEDGDKTYVTPADTHAVADINKIPVPLKKKRSLSYRLLNGSRQMLANLELPQVKFFTEKNKGKKIPKIKMQIDTPKTAIIATLYE